MTTFNLCHSGERSDLEPAAPTGPPVCIPQPPIVTAYGTFPQPCRPSPPCTSVSNSDGTSTQYNSAYTGTDYLNLLRMDTSGNWSTITLGSWNISGDCYGSTYAAPTNANVITNADQGTLVTWQLDTGTQGSTGQSKQTTYYIATTDGTSLASQNTMPKQITPVLQAQDGTFFGTSDQGGMVRFDQSGNIKWSVGDSPQIATADDGLVGTSGTTYDNNGNAIGQVANVSTKAWFGDTYQVGSGSIRSVEPVPVNPATTMWAFLGGGPSGKGTSAKDVFRLGGPTGTLTTYKGTPFFACGPLGPGLPPKISEYPVFYGYQECEAYTVLDNGNPPRTIKRSGIRFDEQVSTMHISSNLVGAVFNEGSGATDNKGILTDDLALGNTTSPLPAGSYAFRWQIIHLHKNHSTVRMNCLNYQTTDVTVTDTTDNFDAPCHP